MEARLELRDIRRLTGANFLMSTTGAAAEAPIDEAQKPAALALWRRETRAILDGVGWAGEQIAMRAFDGGATLQISAPTDVLYAATEIIEAGWSAAQALLEGEAVPNRAAEISRLKDQIETERSPAHVALVDAARAHDVTFLGHDGKVSLGLGKNCQTFPAKELPAPEAVDWDQIDDIPVAMITGTNGKSTTVRLSAAIGAAAGVCVGMSTSDWVRVGGEILDEGDYSGPAGARLAVRDTRVDLAIIEAARGGMMRRGLPVPRANACLITNIAADHLGSYGIMDVASLADAKFQLADAIRPGGRLVLNADEPELVSRSAGFEGEITWYSLDLDSNTRDVLLATGGRAATIIDGVMTLIRDGETEPVLNVNDFKPGMRGAAQFNISNALGAIGLADALGLPVAAMKQGLGSFTGSPDENPGRGNFIEVGGITLLVDFAHNPHGILALGQAVKGIPAKRRLMLAGQAGDRSDDDTREMTRAIWSAEPDMVVIKELPKKLRGRKLGELTVVIADELARLGATSDMMMTAEDEFVSVRQSLEWARPGDFLVLLLHEDRKESMELIAQLQESGWQAGDPLPSQGSGSNTRTTASVA
ncbi:MAG: Mur ligase [Rhodobacteraceae bacterium]|nr:Mur ligase [Paracoccaceae bacterium]